MRRKLAIAGLLFLILAPSLFNFVSAVYRPSNWVVSVSFGTLLLLANVYVWRKTLYAMWLGLPLKTTGDYWPGDKTFWRMRKRPAASYFLRALEKTLARRFEMDMSTRFLGDIVQEMILFQTQVIVDSSLLRGRRWRKAAPSFEKFLEAYFQGFGYGKQLHVKRALELWESVGFDPDYIRYMAAVGPDDAAKMMAENMPVDYAVAMRVER